MHFWRRSIQWQLITSMGAALLVSILIVVGIYTVAVNRLTERYLVDTALPASMRVISESSAKCARSKASTAWLSRFWGLVAR